MDKKLFKRLVKSIKQMGEVDRDFHDSTPELRLDKPQGRRVFSHSIPRRGKDKNS